MFKFQLRMRRRLGCGRRLTARLRLAQGAALALLNLHLLVSQEPCTVEEVPAAEGLKLRLHIWQ